MRCNATFLEKTVYVADRNINLKSLGWIDGLNNIQFPDENETCQTLTPEPTNVENLVRGCDQCSLVVKILHPSIHIQSLKPDFPRTQL
ncbi:unnamed protein product [Hymenolepis diminuta]|uniref:Uncharacterized protein n=1 Tax=Hymenolepis diminuta TaxID=6216 RepID=A0A564Z560_HYMDI|nr:unnamed protein product [Hymenolepis diminuta]